MNAFQLWEICYCLSCDSFSFSWTCAKNFSENNHHILIMHERLVHYLKSNKISSILLFLLILIDWFERILSNLRFLIGEILQLFFFFIGYSRNQTAPMSPRSYSAYSNAYGSSASSYGVPSPGFLNGMFSILLCMLGVVWLSGTSVCVCSESSKWFILRLSYCIETTLSSTVWQCFEITFDHQSDSFSSNILVQLE